MFRCLYTSKMGGLAIQKMEEVKLIDKVNVANVALDMFKFQIHNHISSLTITHIKLQAQSKLNG